MELTKKRTRYGILSVIMVPFSLLGIFTVPVIILSAPLGIITGIAAVRQGDKFAGTIGALLNSILLVAMLALWVCAALSPAD